MTVPVKDKACIKKHICTQPDKSWETETQLFTPLVLHVEETCYINMDPIRLLLDAWDPWWGAGSHW
jgi:hypothetical protein